MLKRLCTVVLLSGPLALVPTAASATPSSYAGGYETLDHGQSAEDDHDHDGDGQPDHDPEDHGKDDDKEGPDDKPKPKPKNG